MKTLCLLFVVLMGLLASVPAPTATSDKKQCTSCGAVSAPGQE